MLVKHAVDHVGQAVGYVAHAGKRSAAAAGYARRIVTASGKSLMRTRTGKLLSACGSTLDDSHRSVAESSNGASLREDESSSRPEGESSFLEDGDEATWQGQDGSDQQFFKEVAFKDINGCEDAHALDSAQQRECYATHDDRSAVTFHCRGAPNSAHAQCSDARARTTFHHTATESSSMNEYTPAVTSRPDDASADQVVSPLLPVEDGDDSSPSPATSAFSAMGTSASSSRHNSGTASNSSSPSEWHECFDPRHGRVY